MLSQGGGRETLEGGSNGHRPYETDFSVRYLAGAVVVVVVHAAATVVFVVVVVIVAVVVLALLRDHGPLALALERDLDRIDGIKWLVVGPGSAGALALAAVRLNATFGAGKLIVAGLVNLSNSVMS